MKKIFLASIAIASIPFRPSVGLDVELSLGREAILPLITVPVEVKIKNPSSEKAAIKAIDLSDELLLDHKQEGLYFFLKSSAGTRRISRPVGRLLDAKKLGPDQTRYVEILPGSMLSVNCDLTLDWTGREPLFEKPGEYGIHCRLIHGAQEADSNTVTLQVVEPGSDADRKALKLLDREVLPCLYMPDYMPLKVESPRLIIRRVLEIYDLDPSPEYKGLCEDRLRLWKRIVRGRRNAPADSRWAIISELDGRTFGVRAPSPPAWPGSTSAVDLATISVALLGLLAWIRGCARRSGSDCLLGLGLGAVCSLTYFLLFGMTRIEWLGAMIPAAIFIAILPFRKMWSARPGAILAVAAAALAAGAAVAEDRFISAGNSLMVIEPYRVGKGWSFDEPRLGLKGEPFVQGVPEMIDELVAGFPADWSVRLIFSQRPFPGSQARFDRIAEESGGFWYRSEDFGMEGWLCPALFKFFTRAPRHLYVKAEPR